MSRPVSRPTGQAHVSNLRQSRRLEGGGAAQGRMALRAMVRRLAPIQPVRLLVRPTANPNPLPAFFASPVRESTSPVRLQPTKPAQCSSRHRHYPPHTIPEPSNFGSPPAEPEDFLWINKVKEQEARSRMAAARKARRSPQAAAALQRRASLVGDGAKWRITNLNEVARAMARWK